MKRSNSLYGSAFLLTELKKEEGISYRACLGVSMDKRGLVSEYEWDVFGEKTLLFIKAYYIF